MLKGSSSVSGERGREEKRRGGGAGKWNAVKVVSAAKEEALIRKK